MRVPRHRPLLVLVSLAPSYERDALIEFLKTLQVLPPGTKDRIVDDRFRAREWPPVDLSEEKR